MDSPVGEANGNRADAREGRSRVERTTRHGIVVRGLEVGFPLRRGRLPVLAGIDLDVRAGEVFGVVGPSGCGKTTLLQVLLGLVAPAAGSVEIDRERTAMVFQRPMLLPWRTVVDNAGYSLECRGVDRAEARVRAAELLGRLGLGDHLEEHPHALSEGMKQRVNLARALLVEPEILLLDEPFSALDVRTRRALQDELLDLWSGRGFTAVFVSHSLEEVVYLCDRVAVLSDKPTRVVDTIAVDLARPRGRGAAARLELQQRVEKLDRLFG